MERNKKQSRTDTDSGAARQTAQSKPRPTSAAEDLKLSGVALPPWQQQIEGEISRKELIKRRTFENAIDISDVDEQFRRDLLDRLGALGPGKRGRVQVSELEALTLIENFEMAKDVLKSEKPTMRSYQPTNAEAARLLVKNLYPGTADALLKRYKRYTKKTGGRK